jgi:hypothetical protein
MKYLGIKYHLSKWNVTVQTADIYRLSSKGPTPKGEGVLLHHGLHLEGPGEALNGL